MDQLDRIRKILNQAEGEAKQGHGEAAENFRNKAFALMAAYGIEQTMLDATEKQDGKPETRTLDLPKPYVDNKGSLLGGIAQALGGKSITTTVRTPGQTRTKYATIVAFPSDLDRIEMLYTSLWLQGWGEVMTTDIPRGETAKSYRNSWLISFIVEVTRRIELAESRAKSDYEDSHGTGTDLVVRDRRDHVSSEVGELFPNLKTARPRYARSSSGWKDGKAAGQRADIGGKRFGGSAKQITQ